MIISYGIKKKLWKNSLNLDFKEYDTWDRYIIREYYNYKIRECLEDKFDILLDYALISETLCNEIIKKILNKIKQTKSENPKEGKEKENFDLNINSNSKIMKEIQSLIFIRKIKVIYLIVIKPLKITIID